MNFPCWTSSKPLCDAKKALSVTWVLSVMSALYFR